jgi:ribosome small subunit-dependent GTPase A
MKGKIIKGIAGFYYVSEGKNIYSCKAKGIFRNRGIKPLVGDNVEFDIINENDKEGNIIEILPRTNQIIRPAVANIDQVLLVQSVKKPKPQLLMLDKYLISMSFQKIPVSIVWNKIDLLEDLDKEYIESIFTAYKMAGYEMIEVSTVNNEGVLKLREVLNKKTTVFAGPSGVGKSSIINMLVPKAFMETGSISERIERGKHTTRHSQLFLVEENSFICDTPGFTSMDIEKIDKNDLRLYYPEFSRFEGKCRFNGCVHVAEPDCAVKCEEVSKIRYNNYIKLYEELKKVRKY